MPKTGLIFAYDFSTFDDKAALLKEIASHVDLIKVGLQAITALGPEHVSIAYTVQSFTGTVLQKKVMWDEKLLDIGNTIEGAAKNIALLSSVSLATLHAQMSTAGLQAVVRAWEGKITPLAVTALTDLDDQACWDRFRRDAAQTVIDFAKIAYSNGIRGFVCSPHEAREIRNRFSDVTIVTPAIRPLWAVAKDEQKRVMTPTKAVQAGADYIVVGRPISKPPEGKTSEHAAREIREELEAA
ncbi:orotidine 5'-phosphate decarboxylase [Candidatus Adlerbacteria bacterium RIFCSPHIGHO2_12_FULL_53_18]|uniref:Orotidine 5'-phosphate decarboxylase n=1 Tax=Candidatus Adlerbacteria bacterium RIFCSPHIGHO2_12_FULL_53_18 TaxID=1797242 RepID=A0A1F4XSY3_9BACT|nr:MAG: orotidine 5'-phosphate decarboxylase [Candidatus Adlerbacteria bacterium RIFCSPHIGHO2_12_FULL_53_18]